jgi:heme/copper-type cytochrome/quinol oxidase subunit 2
MQLISFEPSLLAWTIICTVVLISVIYFVVKYLKRKNKAI